MTVIAKACGNNEHTQLGIGKTGSGQAKPVPATKANEVAGAVTVQAQYFSALMLLEDGTSAGFGGAGDGQMVNGSGGPTNQAPQPIPAPTRYRPARALSCRSAHSIALLKDGTCEAGGGNAFATRGDGTQEALKDIANDLLPSKVLIPKAVDGHIIAVAAGDVACWALVDDGRVLGWGTNGAAQIGDGTLIDRLTPVFTKITNARAIARGWTHGLAILKDGTVVACGSNNKGQCGKPAGGRFAFPVAVKLPGEAVAVAGAGSLSLALLANGDLYEWGELLSTVQGHEPRKVLSGVTSMDAGCYQTVATALARVSNGDIYGWGQNDFGQVGDGTRAAKEAPTPLGFKAQALSCGPVNSYFYDVTLAPPPAPPRPVQTPARKRSYPAQSARRPQ